MIFVATRDSDFQFSIIQLSFSLPDNLLIPIHAIDHGGVLEPAGSAVDYKIHIITQALVNEFRVGQVAYVIRFIVRNCCGEQGSAKLTANLACDVIVRHTYAYLLAVAEYLGQTAAGTQYKGERARQVAFHRLEGGIIYLDILAYVTQVIAHYGETVFLRVHALDLTDTLYGTFL